MALAAASVGLTANAQVFEVLDRAAPAGESSLVNGNFEASPGAKPSQWIPAPKGCVAVQGEGRGGSTALRAGEPTGSGWYGASQAIVLNQTNAVPIIVRGSSKAANVTGGQDSGYSLYSDLVYTDGTHLWGQTAQFHCGTHDWEERQITIVPSKPVRTITLNCILRGHSGVAWFDDVTVHELKSAGENVLFQGVPVRQLPATPASPKRGERTARFATRDGLSLRMVGERATQITLDGTNVTAPTAGGWLARDAAANSDIFAFENGACSQLNLRLTNRVEVRPDHLGFETEVSDTTGRDRAVTLLFALPIQATGWRWHDDIRHHRVLQGRDEFQNVQSVDWGATGTMSLYPLASVDNGGSGIALAIDMAYPAQYRIGYHAGTRQFFIAYDLGLVPDTTRFPSRAKLRFVVFRYDGQWGFRAAFAKLQRIFPDYFAVKCKTQGLWMPFTDVSTVRGWEDFGFRFHEGNNNVAWDDAHDILSFRYTEPMTWWMRMEKSLPRTREAAVAERDRLLREDKGETRRLAQVSVNAAMYDDQDQPGMLFQDAPWCNGAIWSLNPNPHLPGELNGATVHWSPQIKSRLYGPEAKGRLDGEYLDSLEGYVTSELNFRREHFRDTTVPLTFSSDSKIPSLCKGLAVFEFTKWIADDVHSMGKLMFANGVPFRFTFLCPWLDVMGTETDWLDGNGNYRPSSEAQMNLCRTMSGAKPYLLLMNTDYDKLGTNLVERYFQRALFYGMWPGMFSHNAADNPYWGNPKWYDRDRPLFRKYMPIVHQVAEVGWEPVTFAVSENPKVLVERYGGSGSAMFLTVFNDSDVPQSTILRLDAAHLGVPTTFVGAELITGCELAVANSQCALALGAQEARVLRMPQQSPSTPQRKASRGR